MKSANILSLSCKGFYISFLSSHKVSSGFFYFVFCNFGTGIDWWFYWEVCLSTLSRGIRMASIWCGLCDCYYMYSEMILNKRLSWFNIKVVVFLIITDLGPLKFLLSRSMTFNPFHWHFIETLWFSSNVPWKVHELAPVKVNSY